MKFTKKLFSLLLVATLVLSTFSLAACSNNGGGNNGGNGGGGNNGKDNTTYDTSNDLSNYQSLQDDGMGGVYYNKNLFYTNSVRQGGPDPDVFDDTERSGYYYCYVTAEVWRSKNLVEWEDCGPLLKTTTNVEKNIAKTATWAPEVIYDEETEKYIMYLSTSNVGDESFKQEKGVVSGSDWNCNYIMRAAVSDTAQGPFTLVNFNGMEGHDHNTEAGKELTFEQVLSNDYAWVKEGDTYYQAAFPQYFVDYMFFNPEEMYKFLQRYDLEAIRNGTTQKTIGSRNGNLARDNIDPHPYVDPKTGKKYLYAVVGSSIRTIMVIEMKDWLTPNWDNASMAIRHNYYTIEDWISGENEGVPYEQSVINEGPHVLYHEDKNGKGLYYLTYSINNYGSSSYAVATAVAEDIMGPYRKLHEEEGALFINSSTTESTTVSGAGHHSFISVGGQDLVIYHRHNSYAVGGSARYTAIDEYKWITVKDIYGNDMDIPYTNGPTDSVQPLPEAFSEYRNVADEATVTASDSSVNASYLTDGLLSVQKTADATFMGYIKETEITQKTTFSFKFSKPTTIASVLVYDSADLYKSFMNVDLIELVTENGTVKTITGAALDKDRYCEYTGQFGDELSYIASGVAVVTEFYDIKVKEVRVTMDVPEGQDAVGISEIRILGRDGEPVNVGTGDYTFTNPSKVYAEVDEGVTLDGEFTEEGWSKSRWLKIRDTQSKTQYADIEFTTWYGEKGVYFGMKVVETGSNIYYNAERISWANSCIEMYMGPANAPKGAPTIFEFDFSCIGTVTSKLYTNNWQSFTQEREVMPVSSAKALGGAVNTPECYGYQIEAMFPYEYLRRAGYNVEDPSKLELAINPVHIWSLNFTGADANKDRIWSDYWTTQYATDTSTWVNPSAWLKFNKDGLKAYDYNVTVVGNTKVKVEGSTSTLGLIPYGNSATFTLGVVNGGKDSIVSITINGVELPLNNVGWQGAKGTFTLGSVTEDLEIVITTK